MHSAVVEEVKVHCGLRNQQEESLIIYLFYWMESERQGFSCVVRYTKATLEAVYPLYTAELSFLLIVIVSRLDRI
jgi:hypothetical protein